MLKCLHFQLKFHNSGQDLSSFLPEHIHFCKVLWLLGRGEGGGGRGAGVPRNLSDEEVQTSLSCC